MYERTTLYKNNPSLIPIGILRSIYIDRGGWLNNFAKTIEGLGASEKLVHYVLCGPRGMGKTTALILLNHQIEENPDLSLHWISVITPEENPDIASIDDLIMKAISLLTRKYPGRIKNAVGSVSSGFDALLGNLREILLEKRRRLCFMVENIDHILDKILKQPNEEKKFRKIIDSNSILFIGTSITELPEFMKSHDFEFRTEQLPPFKDEDVEAFVDSLSKIESNSGAASLFDKTLVSRIKAISVLAGGVPRYIIFGLNFLREQPLTNLLHALENVLDEVSPFFKHIIEDLPPQEKKVLDALMRQEKPCVSGEIAASTSIGEQTVRELLGRIESRGLIKKEKISRQSFFSPLSPLFQVWYEMRILDSMQEKARARITFLESIYGKEKHRDILYDLERSIHENLEKGCPEEAKKEIHIYRSLLGLKKDSQDLGKRKEFLEKLLELGQYDEALSTAKEILLNGRVEQNVIMQALGQILLGKCLLRSGKSEEAFKEILAAEELLKNSKNPGIIAEFAGLLANAGRYRESIEYFSRALEFLESYNDLRLKADILNNMGISYQFLQENDRAMNCFDEAYQLFKKSGIHEWMAKTLHNEMFSLALMKKYEDAIAHGHESIEIFRELKDVVGIAFTLNNIGNVFNQWGKHGEAVSYYQKALDIFEKTDEKMALGDALNSMGNCYRSLGKLEEAFDSYGKALSIFNETSEVKRLAGVNHNMALTLSSLKKNDRALGYFENAIRLFRETQNLDSLASTLNHAGLNYYSLHRYEEAFSHFQESLKLYQEMRDEEWIAEVNYNTGSALEKMEQFERALGHFNKALPLFEKKRLRHRHHTTLNKVGNCLQSLSRFNEAIVIFEKLIEMSRGEGSRNSKAGALSNLGSSYAKAKEYEKSLDIFRKALHLFEQDKNEEWIAKTLVNMANSLIVSGNYEEALEKNKEAGTIFARLMKKNVSFSSDFLETYLKILLPFIPEAKSVVGPGEKDLLHKSFEILRKDERVDPGPLFELINKYLYRALKQEDYNALSFLRGEVLSFQSTQASSVAELFFLAGERLRGNKEIFRKVDAATSALIERVIESAGIITPLVRVNELMQSENYAAAIDILKQMVEEDPRSAEAAKLLGICYLRTDREDDACRTLLRAFELNRADEQTILELYSLHRKRKEFSESLSSLESLIALRKIRETSDMVKLAELYILNQLYFEAFQIAEEGLKASKEPAERCILDFFLAFIARLTGGKRKIPDLLRRLTDDFRLTTPDHRIEYDFTDLLQMMQQTLSLEDQELFRAIVALFRREMGIDEFVQRYLSVDREAIAEKIGQEVKPFLRDFIRGKIKNLSDLESTVPGAGIMEEFLKNLGDNFKNYEEEEKEAAIVILIQAISHGSESVKKEALDSLGQISIQLPKEGQKKVMQAIFTRLKKDDSASFNSYAANMLRITYPHLDSSLNSWIAGKIGEIPLLFDQLSDLNIKGQGGKR